MDSPVPRHRIVASYLFMAAIVAAVIVQSLPGTPGADKPAGLATSTIDTINAEANSMADDTLPDTDDTDPAPQPPPVEKPKDTLFAVTGPHAAPRHAVTQAREDWHVNLASHTTPRIANEWVERIRAAGFDAAHQRVVHNGRQYWRVYVRGFTTMHAATAEAEKITGRLGLKAYWISKASAS